MPKKVRRNILVNPCSRHGSIHRIGERTFVQMMSVDILGFRIPRPSGTGKHVLPTKLLIGVRIFPS
jgi:hypothetical protein